VEGTASYPASLDRVAGDQLARRVTALARAGQIDGDEWNAVQTELARRRVVEVRSTPIPPSESVRSQILALLAKEPGRTPSQAAATLNRSTTVVSRVLSNLLEAGLVVYDTNAGDGRIRHYRLTNPDTVSAEGDAEPPSATEEERQYLGLVIDAAVHARRKENDLSYAADRLERVLEQATNAKADDLALVARGELVTTLRLAGRFDDVQTQLTAFGEIATGQTNVEPYLVAPAIGCLDYELGLQDSLPAPERLEHLATAATVFRRSKHLGQAHDWSAREGWALLASAELWRQQSQFGIAVTHAERAESIFSEYHDGYGSAEALRVQGFCQRLRGNFSEAIAVLRRAAELATAESADSCLADVLLQLGDALRCVGRLGGAFETLSEADELARRLGRTRTLGFILTALGAVSYASGELGQAWASATEAAPLLASSPPGHALSARRQAVIARDLAADGDTAMCRQSTELFSQSMEQYRALHSPAGIAACCVGLGRVGNEPDMSRFAINTLVGVASSGEGRLLLPLDPWIPALVKRWADESGDPDVYRVADWVYRSDKQGEFADEMAGEPRLESVLFVPTLARSSSPYSMAGDSDPARQQQAAT
jgi:tetratricopeptide (TPR) repeat protein